MKEYVYWLFVLAVVVIVIIVGVDVVAVVEMDDGSGANIGSKFIENFDVKCKIHSIG